MNLITFELVDISAQKEGDRVVCRLPKGSCKVMAFYLTVGKARVVDYLSPKAMSVFISKSAFLMPTTRSANDSF